MKKISQLILFCIAFIFYMNLFAHTHHNEKRYIPKLKRSVNFLGLGTVELGRDWGVGGKVSLHPSPEIAKRVLKTAINHGFDIIDSASSYQLSEQRIGQFIPRTHYNYLIITKPGEHSIKADDPKCKIPTYDNVYCKSPASEFDFSREAIINDVNASLHELKMAQLDIVLLHLQNETAEDVLNKGEALQALKDLKAQGKIKYIGVSVNGPALAIALKQDIDVLEMEYNLLNRSNEIYINQAHRQGLGVIVRGGLGTGLLTEYVKPHLHDPNLPYGDQVRALAKLVNYNYDQLTQLALAFLHQNTKISTVIIGADRAHFIDKDIKLLDSFSDKKRLADAIALMEQYQPPAYFTENLGEYYQ